MSQKPISSRPIIYLGMGRNKYYGVTSANANPPSEFFPYGLFLRFSQDKEETQGLIYDFFNSSAQNSLPPNQRDTLLHSNYFGTDCYVDCYFKTPTIIFSFLEEFDKTFIFKESGSNIIVNKDILAVRIQSLGWE